MGERSQTVDIQVSQVFTPSTPVREADLFAGRIDQIRKVVDAINQDGQHAVVFGERGVGKTSLSNIIANRLRAAGSDVLAPKITCEGADSYASLWRKVLSEIDLIKKKAVVGFQMSVFEETKTAAEVVGDNPTPDDIRRLLTLLGGDRILYIVIDEFDRIANPTVKRALADTIKAFSDHAVPATIIVVGVSDNVDDLIEEHESIERCLVQIRMPRMSPNESLQILSTGSKKLQIIFSTEASSRIVNLSQGLPHYTHLLALHAVRECIDEDKSEVQPEHLDRAIGKAVENAQQSLRSVYYKAVTSPRKDALHGPVLLACALAEPDEFGFFAAADVREPLTKIMGRKYEIPGYAGHLKEFCGPQRGEILIRSGVKHKHRFRFRNPLMQPLVIMQGLVDKQLTPTLLDEIIGYREA
jgi:Cdc6-like AAA superfamily ATPase